MSLAMIGAAGTIEGSCRAKLLVIVVVVVLLAGSFDPFEALSGPGSTARSGGVRELMRMPRPAVRIVHRLTAMTDDVQPANDGDTPAIDAIAAVGVPHRIVRTGAASSAEESAMLQGIPLAALLRTIVVRRGEDDYLFVLVPAGRRFDWPKLRAHLGVTRLSLPDADEAHRVTGYVRYTITPFGSTRAWPVIADASVLGQPVVAIGGGARGVNLHLEPVDLVRALGAAVVDVSVPEPA
jgi:Cys-tRNA(Pro)/Cys-tRNA(Cys) deacylase